MNFSASELRRWADSTRAVDGNRDAYRWAADEIEALEAKVAELTPPLRSECAAHLDAGGTLEHRDYRGAWSRSAVNASAFRKDIADYGDIAMPDYRLVPLPATVTLTIELTRDQAERVTCWESTSIGVVLAAAAAKALGR